MDGIRFQVRLASLGRSILGPHLQVPDSDEAIQGAGCCERACGVYGDRDHAQSVAGVSVRVLDEWSFVLDSPHFDALIHRSSDTLTLVWHPG